MLASYSGNMYVVSKISLVVRNAVIEIAITVSVIVYNQCCIIILRVVITPVFVLYCNTYSRNIIMGYLPAVIYFYMCYTADVANSLDKN